jgi:type III secretion protein V
LLTGLLVCGFVAVPGFPQAQFLLLGSAIATIGWLLRRESQRSRSGSRAPVAAMVAAGSPATPPVLIEDRLPAFTVPALVRVAPDVASRLDPVRFGEELGRLRQQLLESHGLPFPGVRVVVDPELGADGYRLFANDVLAGSGRIQPDILIADRTLVERLAELVQGRPQDFFGLQEARRLLAAAEAEWFDLMREVDKSIPLLRVTDVLRRLLQEGIPIRDMRTIAESLLEWAPREKDAVMLAEYVRLDLGAWIVARQVDDAGRIPALVIQPDTEQRWKAAIQHHPGGSFLAIDPEERGRFCQALGQFLPDPKQARPPALVTTMDLRRYVRCALEVDYPRMPVLSFEEIGTHAPLDVVGTVGA